MTPFQNWSAFTVWWEHSGMLEGAFFKTDETWERRNFQAFSKYGAISVGLDDTEIQTEHDKIWQVRIAEIRKLKAKRSQGRAI